MGEQSGDTSISLTELDARHDELLHQLAELDQRVQDVLKQHAPQKERPAHKDEQALPPLHFGESLVTSDGPSAPTC